MKAKSLLLPTSVVVFATAVGFSSPQQTETPAEKEFKNIQVFKGKPAREVRPAMEGITAALGVGCDFCHAQDAKGEFQWDKDDKEPKKTAREMVVMMNNINKQNFDGRMEVTCATCHQGHSSPNRLAPIGQPRQQPPKGEDAATLPSGESLVDKYVTAVGGSATEKITTLSVKGTSKTAFGGFPFETYAKSSGKLLKLMTFPNGVYTQTYDGTAAWSHFGTETAQVEGPELARYLIYSPLAALSPKASFQGYRRVRKDTFDGKDVFVVDAQTKTEGLRARLYFDAATGLLARKMTMMQTLVGAVPVTEDYSDYREVSGVKIPFKVVETNSSGVYSMEAAEVKANEDIPDAKFGKPK